jgi:hypothetical protein
MAKELRLRRGDTAASDAFIGSSAELTVDTQKKQVRLHDGITPGGFALVKDDEVAVLLSDYNALRSYGGKAKAVRITASGIAGVFVYNPLDTTSVDNGGTVIVSGSKRWKRQINDFVTPEMFGAATDGTLSSSSVINNILSLGYPCYLSKNSVYLITSTINIPSNSKIFGPGKLIRGFDNGSLILALGSSNVKLSEFEIDGRLSLYTSSNNFGIFIDWRATAGAFVDIKDIAISNCSGSSIIGLASALTRSSYVYVSGCRVENSGSHGIILQDYVDNVTIVDNFVKSTSLLVADRPGITASRYGRNINILNNICIGSNTVALPSASVHGISVDISENVSCAGNLCTGWLASGVEITRSNNVSVTGNVINSSLYGILLTGSNTNSEICNGVNISGNAVDFCTGYGISSSIEGTTGTVLHNNISISSNSVTNCLDIGIYLRHVKNLHLTSNNANNNSKSGIQILDCPGYFIDGNTAVENNIETIKNATLTELGGVVTATVTNHQYTTNDIVSIWGAFPSRYNGTGFVITVLDTNTFTYNVSSPGISPAVGTIKCARMANGLTGGTAGTTFGGIRVLWSLFNTLNRGENRYGNNYATRNGFRNVYDLNTNALNGFIDNALFLQERPANIRSENVTSGAIANIKDAVAMYMNNGKLVFAYNNSGALNYLTIPLDGATGTWTNSATAP